MIEVEVRLFNVLRKYRPREAKSDTFLLELPDGAALADLLSALELPGKEVHLTLVNGLHREITHPLRSGDVVSLFPFVAGG